jgi:two-component system, NarL family, response regulator DevR
MSKVDQNSVRILLVEEEALVRAALLALVASWTGFHVIAEASTKDEALQQLRRAEPHVIVVSLGGSEEADLKMIRDMAAVSGRAKLLALVGDCNRDFRLQVVRYGARGVVLRSRPASELQKAIERIHQTDEIWLDRAALASLITQGKPIAVDVGRSELFSRLTDREREIVMLVTQGLKNKDVGQRLFISETTVRHHLTTIFNKLNISSRFELIAYVHAIAGTSELPDSRSADSGQ